MKKLGMIMAIFLTITAFLSVNASYAGRAGKRQVNQQKRIHQGVKSGEVTKREYKRLQREQAGIQRSKKRAWSDGQLTRKEKLRLEHRQDKASRHVYRAKHNDYDRN